MKILKKENFASVSRSNIENILRNRMLQKFENVTNIINETISKQSVRILNNVKSDTGCETSGGNLLNLSGVKLGGNSFLSIEQASKIKCKIEATNKFSSNTNFKQEQLTNIKNELLNNNDLAAKIEAAQKATALYSNTDVNEGGEALVQGFTNFLSDAFGQKNVSEIDITNAADTYIDQQVINEINVDNIFESYFEAVNENNVANSCVNYSSSMNELNIFNLELTDNAKVDIVQKTEEEFVSTCLNETISTLDLLNKLTENVTNYQSNVNAADIMAAFSQDAKSEQTIVREAKSIFSSLFMMLALCCGVIIIAVIFGMKPKK